MLQDWKMRAKAMKAIASVGVGFGPSLKGLIQSHAEQKEEDRPEYVLPFPVTGIAY